MTKTLLLVEDDDNDVFFMELAMERAKITVTLQVVKNGEEAINYLRGHGKFSDRKIYPLPDITLLDLRLPRVPGLEVLKWIRSQPDFENYPVIVLSSSNQDRDVRKARELGADSYLVKPTNPQELTEILQSVQRYWIDMERPPLNCVEWNAITLIPCRHPAIRSHPW